MKSRQPVTTEREEDVIAISIRLLTSAATRAGEKSRPGADLFDAAVQWTSGITNTVSAQPKFDPPVLSGNQVTLSWTGKGNLEQTDSLSPPNWGPAPSQANPQTVPATGTRFYRIRQ